MSVIALTGGVHGGGGGGVQTQTNNCFVLNKSLNKYFMDDSVSIKLM